MRSSRIGNPFPSAIIACMRTGRPPTQCELRSVALRIECEAKLRSRSTGHDRHPIRHALRAALHATGIGVAIPQKWSKP